MRENQLREINNNTEHDRLGFNDLAMNVVPASATSEMSEVPRRTGRHWLLFLAVILAAGLLAWGVRLYSNMMPSQEVEQKFRSRLQSLSAWQTGVVTEVHFIAGDKLRIDITPRLDIVSEEDRNRLRQMGIEVMKAFIEERPNRDLYLIGFQGDSQVMQARYRAKSTLTGPSGEKIPDIIVKIEGESESGMATRVTENKPK